MTNSKIDLTPIYDGRRYKGKELSTNLRKGIYAVSIEEDKEEIIIKLNGDGVLVSLETGEELPVDFDYLDDGFIFMKEKEIKRVSLQQAFEAYLGGKRIELRYVDDRGVKKYELISGAYPEINILHVIKGDWYVVE